MEEKALSEDEAQEGGRGVEMIRERDGGGWGIEAEGGRLKSALHG